MVNIKKLYIRNLCLLNINHYFITYFNKVDKPPLTWEFVG